MRVELLLDYRDGVREVLPVTMEAAVTPVPAAAGRPAPQLVFANHGDWGYGLFELDADTFSGSVRPSRWLNQSR